MKKKFCKKLFLKAQKNFTDPLLVKKAYRQYKKDWNKFIKEK